VVNVSVYRSFFSERFYQFIIYLKYFKRIKRILCFEYSLKAFMSELRFFLLLFSSIKYLYEIPWENYLFKPCRLYHLGLFYYFFCWNASWISSCFWYRNNKKHLLLQPSWIFQKKVVIVSGAWSNNQIVWMSIIWQYHISCYYQQLWYSGYLVYFLWLQLWITARHNYRHHS